MFAPSSFMKRTNAFENEKASAKAPKGKKQKLVLLFL